MGGSVAKSMIDKLLCNSNTYTVKQSVKQLLLCSQWCRFVTKNRVEVVGSCLPCICSVRGGRGKFLFLNIYLWLHTTLPHIFE